MVEKAIVNCHKYVFEVSSSSRRKPVRRKLWRFRGAAGQAETLVGVPARTLDSGFRQNNVGLYRRC
jgi:hypothetical protein